MPLLQLPTLHVIGIVQYEYSYLYRIRTSTSPAMTSSAPGPSTSTGTGTGTAVSTGQFSFPPIHSYPPFYSLQVNTSTLQSQLSTWSTIVRDYCRHRRLFRLSLSDQLDSALFYNRPLGKRLKEDDARRVLDFMRERQASAEPADGVSGVGGAAAAKRKADVWWIWWRKVDEWAGIIEAWVGSINFNGRCCFPSISLYEILIRVAILQGSDSAQTFPSTSSRRDFIQEIIYHEACPRTVILPSRRAPAKALSNAKKQLE